LILGTLGGDKHELKSPALGGCITRHDIRVVGILTHEELAELRIHLLDELATDVDWIDGVVSEWMTRFEDE
jgi:hypothetical protein